jgi:DNA-binding ferritin-like protein
MQELYHKTNNEEETICWAFSCNLYQNYNTKLYYRQMLQIALDDHETIIRSMRKATELSAQYDDWATNNMLASLLEKLEKNAWMIRAHLAEEKENHK